MIWVSQGLVNKTLFFYNRILLLENTSCLCSQMNSQLTVWNIVFFPKTIKRCLVLHQTTHLHEVMKALQPKSRKNTY